MQIQTLINKKALSSPIEKQTASPGYTVQDEGIEPENAEKKTHTVETTCLNCGTPFYSRKENPKVLF